jgi:hypothetical protein
MWIIRLILVLLGFLLLRRLFSPLGGGKRKQSPGSSRADATSPPSVPYSEADIQDAEYEDVDGERGGEGERQ